MAGDKIEIVLKATIDESSEEQIMQEIKSLENRIKPLGVKVEVDKSSFEDIKEGTEEIVTNYKHLEDGSKRITSENRKISNELGKQTIEMYKAKEGTNELYLDETRILNAIKLSTDQIHKQTIAQETLLNQVKKTVALNKEYIEYGNLGQQYADLEQSIRNLNPESKEFNNLLAEQKLRFQQLGTDVSVVKKEVRDASRFISIFGEQILEAGRKFLTWYLIGGVIVSTLRQIRDGITFLKELDKDLTEISMITGLTRDQTRELALGYAQLGAEMGKTAAEISKVNTELVRQGLSLDVASERMEVILKLSAAAGIETSESLQIITSSVNAMGEGAEKTSDILLKAGAVSASSAAQIGEAFTKTASSARATGVSIENLTAIISTLIEVTQESPSSLGNSMKTLLARFNKVNEETGELNTEINNVQKAFESVGVTFLDLDGQIRSVDELLFDLSQKWDSLDKNTQMYIATQAAGVRQQNRFLAIMDNYNRVLEIQNELTGAAGTTNLQYSHYLNSVEAASNRTKVALEQMWIKSINTDIIKHFYNLTTVFVKLIDKIGLFRIALMALIFALSTAKKSVGAFVANLYYIPAAMVQSIMMGRTLSQTLYALGEAFGFVKIKAALTQAVLTFGVSFAITYLIEGIMKLVGAMDEARRKNEELLSSYQQTVQQNNAHISSLQAIENEYENLRKKTSPTIEEQKRLVEIQNEIANISPSVVQGYDEQGNAIINFKGNVQDLIEELKELNRQEAYKLVAGGADAFKVMASDIGKAEEQLDLLNGKIEHLQGTLPIQELIHISSRADLFWEKNNAGLKQYEEALAKGIITEQEFIEIKKELENKIENLSAQKSKLTSDINTATDAFRPYMKAILDSSDAFEKLDEEQKQFLYDFVSSAKDFGDSWDEASINLRNLIDVVQTSDFQGFINDIDELNSKFEEGKMSSEEYEEEFNKLIVAMAELFDLDPEFLAEIFRKALPEVEAVGYSVEEAAQEINDAFDAALSSFDLLSKAIDELDKYGQISLKTMFEIFDKHAELIIPMLIEEGDIRAALTQSIVDQEALALKAFEQKVIQQLEASTIFFNEILRGNKEVWDAVGNMYGVDTDNFTTAAKAKIEIDNAVRRIVGEEWAKTYGTTAEGIGQMISILQSQLSSLSEYTDNWARSSSVAIISQINQLETLQAALNSISSSVSSAVRTIDLVPISLGNVAKSANKAAKSANKAAKSAAKTAKALKDPYEEWRKEAERIANEVVKIIQDAYRKQKKIALATIDAERKAAEKAHKERIKQYDEQYKRYEELIKLRMREIDDEADEEDFQRELIKLKEEQGKIESEIAKLALDDSYEARAKREQLEKELAAKIEEIENLTRNRSKELRKQSLQDQLDNMKKEIEAKKEQENEMYEAEKERLEKIRKDTEYHYNELINNEIKFQELRQAILKGNVKEAQKILGEFVDYFSTINKDVAKDLDVSFQNILNIMDAAQKAMKDLKKLGTPPPSTGGAKESGGYGDSGGYGGGGGGGAFQDLAASSAAAAKSIKTDWEEVAKHVGKQFGLTEDALKIFIDSFTREMEEGATVTEAFESAWADASANIIDNFNLTEEQVKAFQENFKWYFWKLMESGYDLDTALEMALDNTIGHLNLTEAEAEVFKKVFTDAMKESGDQGKAFDKAFAAVKDNLKTNLEVTGISLAEFSKKFEKNMKTSETSSEALEKTWEEVARDMAINSGMTGKEVDIFAKSFANNMMKSDDAAGSLEKAFEDASKEIQKDSKNNKKSVKDMVDEIVKKMRRKVPTLKTKVENTIVTIHEIIEKTFSKKHEGGIAGIETAHTGRIAGGASNPKSKDLWNLSSKKLSPDEVMNILLKGEVVLNPKISLPIIQDNILRTMGEVANVNHNSDQSIVNNLTLNLSGGYKNEMDAKNLAKITLQEIYRGQRRMGKH